MDGKKELKGAHFFPVGELGTLGRLWDQLSDPEPDYPVCTCDGVIPLSSERRGRSNAVGRWLRDVASYVVGNRFVLLYWTDIDDEAAVRNFTPQPG